MSFVTTQPEALSAAATNLQGIGSAVSSQNAAAASPTTGVVPAAADEVSALTAAQFVAHAQLYQAVSAQASAIHEMFVNTLGTSAGSYAATEAANAAAAAWNRAVDDVHRCRVATSNFGMAGFGSPIFGAEIKLASGSDWACARTVQPTLRQNVTFTWRSPVAASQRWCAATRLMVAAASQRAGTRSAQRSRCRAGRRRCSPLACR